MYEHEENADFNAKLLKIANISYSLGKRISKEELVRKNLRSLLDRFLIKIATIEKYYDISTMTKIQVISKLQTFEMNHLKNNKEKVLFFS